MAPQEYRIDTPFGPMVARWSELGLSRLSFVGTRSARKVPALPRVARGPQKRLSDQLSRYLGRGAWQFDVPLDLSSGTEFDRMVWRALARIKCGTLRTYGQIARSIGRPMAARAVGNACGRNPIPVVIPCHRVVASSGIGGFGLGLELKRRLLALEGTHV